MRLATSLALRAGVNNDRVESIDPAFEQRNLPGVRHLLLTLVRELRYVQGMFRFVLVLSLTLSLLWCPINCMAGTTGDVAPQTAKKTGCACCPQSARDHEGTSPTDFPNPPNPDEDCECGNCLCHGAVRSDEDPAADEDAKRMFDHPPLLQVELSQLLGLSPAIPQELPARKPGGSGCAVCILHQAFLL